LYLFGTRVVWGPTAIFSTKPGSKNAGEFFGLWLVRRIFVEFQHPAIQTKIVHHCGGFFHEIIVRQPIGRKDSVQTMIGTSRRLD
jgi:hypothetical protein